MNTFALLTADDGAFIVDLESVQRFDRLMLRWNQRNNLRGRPNHIRIEVSNDNNLYTAIADYDNSMGSIMTNIILPDQVEGRYVKIIPSGLLGISRSEEHTSELQSRPHLVCRLLLEKKKKLQIIITIE